MRVLRLSLENWRNFRKVDVPLQQRVFIAGPNASGKSNLLDAIRFLQDIGGGFEDAVSKRGGVSKIRCLTARRYSDIVIEIDLGLDSENPDWKYKIAFSQDNQSIPILKEETVFHKGEKVISRPDEKDKEDKKRLTQTHLQQVSANQKFREIADFLNSVRYLHVVPQIIRDPDRFSTRLDRERDPFGGDFLEQIAKTPNKIQLSRLKKIKNALKVAVPQLGDLKLERDEHLGTPHLSGLFEHWHPNAGWQREDQFSDGTLRLMGLLWAVLDGKGPLLLEEPELSLHLAVVQHIPSMLWKATRKSRRQIFITTHSFDLLSDKGIAADETLLLQPDREGTKVTLAIDDHQIASLLEAGISIAEAALPKVAPKRPDQFVLFGNP